jgi:WD40 repeat protein
MRLHGHLRGLAWDRIGDRLTVVGNHGVVLRIAGSDQVRFDSPMQVSLRAVDLNPVDGTALIVGNAGTVLQFQESDRFQRLSAPTFENLRAVAWNPDGNAALIAGNNGTLLKYSGGAFQTIDGARANLRRISWKPRSEEVLIASNCFAEEFVPSPNLFRFKVREGELRPANEGRADFIGLDWGPTGELALVVGYDVVWHNGFIGAFDGSSLSPVQFENKNVYPVTVACHPKEKIAAIGTATTQPGVANGTVFSWNGESLKSIYSDARFFFGALAWDPDGKQLAALASSATRTFNC